MPRNIAATAVYAVFDGMLEGKTLRAACEEAGVAVGDVLRRAAKSPSMKARMDETQRTALAVVEDALYETAVKGNATALTFYLCNREPERWRPASAARVESEVAADSVTPAELIERYRRHDAADADVAEAAG